MVDMKLKLFKIVIDWENNENGDDAYVDEHWDVLKSAASNISMYPYAWVGIIVSWCYSLFISSFIIFNLCKKISLI